MYLHKSSTVYVYYYKSSTVYVYSAVCENSEPRRILRGLECVPCASLLLRES